MEIKTDISLQTKQVLSQVQMQSLNILSMSMTELEEFLQNEEIENPLVEYSSGRQEGELPVAYREYDRFYNGASREGDSRGGIYEADDTEQSVEHMIMMQLPWKTLTEEQHRIVKFCIHSLDQNGYLTVPPSEIAEALKAEVSEVEYIVSRLKELEPVGIFASSLEECLVLQVLGMEQEAALCTIIRNHLQDVADGKVSTISRRLKLSSVEVRKLIHVIRNLNPRPLNGYGGDRAQYVFPDIILNYQDGQWTVSLNDKWAGNISINEFYVHMMETAQDEELKNYFEEKLKRARFIMNAVEQRRRTLEGITEGILKRQAGYFLGKEPLKPMTLEEIAAEREIHKSTVSRAIRDKYILTPAGCLLIRDLFTTGISGGGKTGEDVSRNTVKSRLKALVDQEDKKHPCSDGTAGKAPGSRGNGHFQAYCGQIQDGAGDRRRVFTPGRIKKREAMAIMAFTFKSLLPTPELIKAEFPLSDEAVELKEKRDKEIAAVFTGESDKFLVIIGPCSADREDSVCEYMERLARVSEKVGDKLILIPRVYTNKPRTTGGGYKGMLHQPNPEKKPNMYEGLVAIRKLHMRAIQDYGFSTADEMLYPENYSYLSDVLSYIAIGARSVENQQHRLTSSGVDVPVGMKNPTGGDLGVMLNAVYAAQHGHDFIYRTMEVTTDGNPLAHTILRGAVSKHGQCIPNYHYEDLELLLQLYGERELVNPACIVDANHSNSNKRYEEQVRIVKEVLHSRRYSPDIHKFVKGVMIESYLEPGSQKIGEHIYGKSITDPCLGWEESERLLYDIAEEI